MTSCQRRYREAFLQSFEGDFLPQCKLDGRYEEVQCEGSSGECWCVDQNGKKLSGTNSTQLIKCPISGKSSNCPRKY